jgi:hypothetical protein
MVALVLGWDINHLYQTGVIVHHMVEIFQEAAAPEQIKAVIVQLVIVVAAVPLA